MIFIIKMVKIIRRPDTCRKWRQHKIGSCVKIKRTYHGERQKLNRKTIRMVWTSLKRNYILHGMWCSISVTISQRFLNNLNGINNNDWHRCWLCWILCLSTMVHVNQWLFHPPPSRSNSAISVPSPIVHWNYYDISILLHSSDVPFLLFKYVSFFIVFFLEFHLTGAHDCLLSPSKTLLYRFENN